MKYSVSVWRKPECSSITSTSLALLLQVNSAGIVATVALAPCCCVCTLLTEDSIHVRSVCRCFATHKQTLHVAVGYRTHSSSVLVRRCIATTGWCLGFPLPPPSKCGEAVVQLHYVETVSFRIPVNIRQSLRQCQLVGIHFILLCCYYFDFVTETVTAIISCATCP